MKKSVLKMTEAPQDFLLKRGSRNVWIEVDGFSINIQRRAQDSGTLEVGVLVDIFQNGNESASEPLASCMAYKSELKKRMKK